MKKSNCFLLSVLLFIFFGNNTAFSQSISEYDVVVYGGTSAGITAAIQSSRMGKTVVLIEPGQRIGGLSTGGLGQRI